MDTQKKEITMAIAARIRYFRQVNGLSQEALALRANINPSYFGQLERGLKCPTVDTLYKIAAALDIPLSELVRLEGKLGQRKKSDERFRELLAQVPEGKSEQLLQLLEDIVVILKE